jgi:hypothetical protein
MIFQRLSQNKYKRKGEKPTQRNSREVVCLVWKDGRSMYDFLVKGEKLIFTIIEGDFLEKKNRTTERAATYAVKGPESACPRRWREATGGQEQNACRGQRPTRLPRRRSCSLSPSMLNSRSTVHISVHQKKWFLKKTQKEWHIVQKNSTNICTVGSTPSCRRCAYVFGSTDVVLVRLSTGFTYICLARCQMINLFGGFIHIYKYNIIL